MTRKNITKHITLVILVISILTSSGIIPANAVTWASAQKLGMYTLSDDSSLKFVDAAPPSGTSLKTDSAIKYIDANSNSQWDPGETVVYDSNLNNRFDIGEALIAGTTPSAGTPLRPDGKIRLVDANNNNLWDAGEAVVYDSNSNNMYDSGELTVAGSAPKAQSILVSSSRVKYFDSNNNNAWDVGEAVVYETISNGIYETTVDSHIKWIDSNNNLSWDIGEPVVFDSDGNGVYGSGEPVLSWSSPTLGASLKSSSNIRIIDANRNGAWDAGEAVVIDINANNVYDAAEPVMAGANPAAGASLILGSTPRIKFVDTNNNNMADPGEPVVYDSNDDNTYSRWTDSHIKFIDSSGGNGHWDPGEAVIYDANNNNMYDCLEPVIVGTPPNCIDTPPLIVDPLFRFIDSNRNGAWSSGEAVLRDVNSDFIYNSGDIMVTGTPPPTGTLLSEPLIGGPVPAGTPTLKLDSSVKFVSLNGDAVWDPGEPVVRDTNNDGIYQLGEPVVSGIPPASGTLLSEPVIAGPTPSINASLKSDAKVKYVDTNGNSVWDPGEIVAYDTNNNNLFDQGETVIAGAAKGTDGVWNFGEVVVYDANNDSTYNTGDTAVAGSSPPNGTPVNSDSKVRYFDSNLSGKREAGEIVVYDANNNHEYDFEPSAEPVIAGPNPDLKQVEWPSIAPDSNGRIWLTWNEYTIGSTEKPDVYFRIWDGSAWGIKHRVTNDPGIDNTNFVLSLSDQTMMILWSSSRTGNLDLFYKIYSQGSNPVPLTGDIQLTTNTLYDQSPSAIQDRYGRVWVTWMRRDASGSRSDVYYKYYMNGNWYGDFVLPVASSPTLQEVSPAITQTKDGKMMITFASNDTGSLDLYTTTTDGTLETLPTTGIPPSSWSAKRLLFSTNDEDDHPSMTLARDGTLWLFFQRTPATGSGGSQLYVTSSTDNGNTFSSPSLFADLTDSSPSAGQMRDGRIWVFWNRLGNLTDEIWYSNSAPPLTGIHDVGVRSIVTSPKFVKSGNPAAPAPPVNVLNINVTVSNYGDFTETTQLTMKLNNTIVTTVSLTLSAGEVRLVQYGYATTLGFWGRYIPAATLQSVAGETSILQGDNTISGGLVRIAPPGDVDGNGVVNILDAATVAYSYGTHPGDLLWNPNADVNYDGKIDILDAAVVAFYYLKSV